MARLANAGVGIWLMAAPAVLGYGGLPAAHDRIVGPLVASFAISAIWGTTRGLRWCNVVLGAWLVVGAFVMGYEGAGVVNAAICGLVIAGLGLVKGKVGHAFGGGWGVVLRGGGA